jgi:hypothetical protein
MRALHQRREGPSSRHSRARLSAVKTPRAARPRLCRADGLDRASGEPRMALVDGQPSAWQMGAWRPVAAPAISLTIGLETRSYLALITSAPPALDAPSTITLHTAAWREVPRLRDRRPARHGESASSNRSSRARRVKRVRMAAGACPRGWPSLGRCGSPSCRPRGTSAVAVAQDRERQWLKPARQAGIPNIRAARAVDQCRQKWRT